MAQAKTNTIVGTLDFEKETKNAVRYTERDDSPAMGAFGTLYVQKMGLRVAGFDTPPATITVTLEASA